MLNHPGVAAVLSFLLPGLGQIYNGEAIFATIHMGIHILLLGFMLSKISHYPFNPAPLPFIFMFIMANCITSSALAYKQAKNHNAELIQENQGEENE